MTGAKKLMVIAALVEDGHGESGQGASRIEGLDRANDNMEKRQDGDATGEWHGHERYQAHWISPEPPKNRDTRPEVLTRVGSNPTTLPNRSSLGKTTTRWSSSHQRSHSPYGQNIRGRCLRRPDLGMALKKSSALAKPLTIMERNSDRYLDSEVIELFKENASDSYARAVQAGNTEVQQGMGEVLSRSCKPAAAHRGAAFIPIRRDNQPPLFQFSPGGSESLRRQISLPFMTIVLPSLVSMTWPGSMETAPPNLLSIAIFPSLKT